MRRHLSHIVLTLAVLGLLAGWRTTAAHTSSAGEVSPAGQNPDVLAALLVEVRGLRSAMEQMASAGPRVQLAMGRLQLQEQRVNSLMRQLDTARANLAQTERQEAEVRQQIASLEDPGAKGRDNPDERAAAAQQIQHLKAQQALAATDVQRFQTEEATIAQQLAAEQGRWSDINRSLEELERALARN